MKLVLHVIIFFGLLDQPLDYIGYKSDHRDYQYLLQHNIYDSLGSFSKRLEL